MLTWGDQLKSKIFKTYDDAITAADDAIDLWHDDLECNLHLTEHLGLSIQEYQDFIIEPTKLINPFLAK